MTFTPETGAGTLGANSYASLTDAADYHALRKNDDWAAAASPAQVAALVLATDYIEANFRAPGWRLIAEQGLQWPVSVSEGVPLQVRAATVILALYALKGPLSAPAARGIKSTKESLEGVVLAETVYDDAAPADPYPAVTALMSQVADTRGSGSITFGRVIF